MDSQQEKTGPQNDRPAIFQAMSEEIERQRDQIRAEAQEEAHRILDEARSQAKVHEKAAVEEELRRQNGLTEQAKRAAAYEAMQAGLAMRHAILTEVLKEVRDRLAALASAPSFEAYILSLLLEAIEAAEAERWSGISVLAPQRFAPACRTWLVATGREEVKVEVSPGLCDGVVVEGNEGRSRITNTLLERSVRLEEEVRNWCTAALFEDGIAVDGPSPSGQGRS